MHIVSADLQIKPFQSDMNHNQVEGASVEHVSSEDT